jgi:SAM-dependent methyltransferase
MSRHDEETINRWVGSAPYWEKHREIIREMFDPISQALIEEANVTKRNVVLDVATGPGEPALSIAEVVGAEGKVFGIDPIQEMVAAARRAADRLGYKNAQFDVAFADRLPFSRDTFDAVVSRFGVMFFPSPVDGVREMLRVLKPGSKLALAVWHFAERNPFHYTLSQIVDRYVEPPPLPPDAPDAFRFATPGKLRDILTEAGAIASSERVFRFSIRASMSVHDFWTLRTDMSEKLREKLAILSEEQTTELKDTVIDALRAYSINGELNFPAQVLILSGTKLKSDYSSP